MAVVRILVNDVDTSLPFKGLVGQQALAEAPSGNPIEIFQPRPDA